ncbi:acyltransferase family protein [Micromonospora endolithica]|uniref:Acyltransferase n=1 Tax=Micromonospora endolithica TaxID=230091 RepID=A0A3A9ZED7_9ACTN|nr:acyltransferase [Micromonospora endolithica]RKN46475.1 acyltransferase [Micromonospora endolithica]
MVGVRRLAERTPPERERFVDLLRAVAITAVVLGHWLVTVVGYQDGQLTGRSALPDLRWAYPITWLVQVMPIFFLVGGYANAASLTSARRKGQRAGDWLVHRAARLVRPTTALVAVLAAGAGIARLLEADPQRVRLVVWFAAIPLWFLAVYLIVVTLTPLMWVLHRRYGAAVPVVLLLLVAAGDLARLSGQEAWGNGSFLFGWLAIHQVGFFWRDGRLPTRPRVLWAMLAGGAVVLVVLTVPGPYPVSMINVPGERLHNMSPPSLALLALLTVQLAVALLTRRRAERWLHRTRPWMVVIAVNAVILTVFLWHITAAILLTAALHTLDVLPTPTAGSAAWFAWRLPWLTMLTTVLAVLVALFGPIEIRGVRTPRHRPRWLPALAAGALARPAPRLMLAVTGMAAVSFGLLDNSLLPRTQPAPLGIPTIALSAYVVGALLLRILRAVPPTEPAHRNGGQPPSRRPRENR